MRSKKTNKAALQRNNFVSCGQLNEYKNQKFNFTINTGFMCFMECCGKECEICFSLYEPTKDELFKIFKKLDSYRSWDWRKIEQSGNGTSCGYMDIRKLDVCDFILDHFEKIVIDDDVIYKMEISNKHRVWGIRRGNILYLLWNDEFHYFYKHKDSNYTPPKK